MTENEPLWTIIKDGKALIEFTSMLSMAVNSESSLPEEPLENGSFATYNRVVYSDRLEVRLGIEGDEAELPRAQDILKELKAGTDVFSLVTPDYEHQNLTLEGYDYTRDTSAGHGLLVVDLKLKEIREVETTTTVVAVAVTPSAQTTDAGKSAGESRAAEKPLSEKNCKDGSAVSKKQTGKTQTAEPDAKQKESIAYKIFGGSGGGSGF